MSRCSVRRFDFKNTQVDRRMITSSIPTTALTSNTVTNILAQCGHWTIPWARQRGQGLLFIFMHLTSMVLLILSGCLLLQAAEEREPLMILVINVYYFAPLLA